MKKSKLFKICSLCFFSMLFFSMCGADSAYAKWVTYSFKNYSGRTIKSLYVSSSGYNKWGDDMCGSSVLSSGESLSMKYNNRTRYFDVKVVWMDGSSTTWSKKDFKAMWRLTLYRNGSTYYLTNN